MEKPYPIYFDATALRREYLVGDAFFAKYNTISRDFIWQEQNERFKRQLGRAWRMQFYRRFWGEHGIKPGEIRSLLDIEKLPVLDATYLLSAEKDPALFGDFTGRDSYAPGFAPPLVDNCFGPRGAEIKHLLIARAAILQGSAVDDLACFLARPQANRNPIGLLHPHLYQNYSIELAGVIAVEGMDRNGLYVMEDAHFVELLSSKAERVADGMPGELVVTSLYKDDIAPLIRFNTHDIASIYLSESSVGLNLRRIQLHSQQ